MRVFVKKLFKGLFNIVVILMASCMVLTGCFMYIPETEYEKGFKYHRNGVILIGVRADTDIFDIDNVSFDVYYGMYDLDAKGSDPKDSYISSIMGDKLVFGMYICDSIYSEAITNDKFIPDYTDIENHLFIRSISEDEAFSNEFGYTDEYGKGTTYNHNERITVPMEVFNKDRGSFSIKIIGFQEPLNEGGDYYTNRRGYVELDYELTNENKVKIIFNW